MNGSPRSLYWIVGFYAAAVALETALVLRRGPRAHVPVAP